MAVLFRSVVAGFSLSWLQAVIDNPVSRKAAKYKSLVMVRLVILIIYIYTVVIMICVVGENSVITGGIST
jgi:hypothetical protein